MTDEQKKELQELIDAVDDDILATENLMDQFEPDSVEYVFFLNCKSRLKWVLCRLTERQEPNQ